MDVDGGVGVCVVVGIGFVMGIVVGVVLFGIGNVVMNVVLLMFSVCVMCVCVVVVNVGCVFSFVNMVLVLIVVSWFLLFSNMSCVFGVSVLSRCVVSVMLIIDVLLMMIRLYGNGLL